MKHLLDQLTKLAESGKQLGSVADLDGLYTTMLDLVEWIEPMGNTGESHCRIQCAVSNSLYEQIGKPKFFKEFAPGYMWNTYTGEKYQPLFSSDQPALDAIARELFDWSS